ncbi:MAG: hypothetical protein KGI06_02765 [Candidatus Micrarchaeota archaeon]|nr:hypothetical protein [Candidatus Micrarchaeota archaeon]
MAKSTTSRAYYRFALIGALVLIAVAAMLFLATSSSYTNSWSSIGPGFGMVHYWNFSGETLLNSSQLGSMIATESSASVSNNTLYFNGSDVRMVVLMGPMGKNQSMYSFVIDNLTNPTLVFQKGARVTMFVVNIDTDASHSLTVVDEDPPYSYGMMPMMMYSYASSMMLPPNSNEYFGQEVSFSANGDAYYICTVPGHAQKGMYGRIIAE